MTNQKQKNSLTTWRYRFAMFILILFVSGIHLTTKAQIAVLNINNTNGNGAAVTGSWTAPSNLIYKVRITAKGAKGGDFYNSTAGMGAIVISEFLITGGQTITAIAGAPGGGGGWAGLGAGGGGSSGAHISNNILIVAGAGGGAQNWIDGANAVSEPGNGQGGNAGDSGGGGGILSNGQYGAYGSAGGGSFANGGFGGNGGSFGGNGGINGGAGFTGGGGVGFISGGGGGGYSGGYGNSGGGSSYSIGSNTTISNTHNGSGQVIIEILNPVLVVNSPNPSTNPTLSSYTSTSGGAYKITAMGAKGGNNYNGAQGGNGSMVSGYFKVNPGQIFEAVAGSQGFQVDPNVFTGGGGGGGASGVRISNGNSPLLIAGGGSGGGYLQSPTPGSMIAGNGAGGFGINNALGGAGGGGLLTAGENGGTNGNGSAPTGGGAGYNATGGAGRDNGVLAGNGGGGYGAGGGGNVGGGAGGGGGYSGGNGSDGGSISSSASGGSSFNAGTGQQNTSNVNNGGGQVIIEKAYPYVSSFQGCGNNITISPLPGQCYANYTLPIPTYSITIPGYTELGILNGHRYFKSTNQVTWAKANFEAIALGGHLVTISSAAENVLVTTSDNVWIGLSDELTEGNYAWVNGEPFGYTNWNAGEPNNYGGDEDYIELYSNGTWNDGTSTATHYYVVEFDDIGIQQTYSLTIPGYTDLGTLNGHRYYKSSNQVNWATAKAEALALGGHLVSITSPVENALVTNSDNVWIGLSDEVTEGNYAWVNGDPLGYTNWNVGEPNNAGGGEDYIELISNGKWNDNSSTATRYYVVEFDDTGIPTNSVTIPGYTALGTLNGHYYYKSSNQVNWATAKAEALALGGQLVSITSPAENALVTNSDIVWIGLTDELAEGSFAWDDGSPFAYSNWYSGEPNNSGGNEDYVNLYPHSKWNDANGSDLHYYIVEFDEIDIQQISGNGIKLGVGTTKVTYVYTACNGITDTCSFNVKVQNFDTTNTYACDSYTWTLNGMTYNQSGTYSTTFSNAFGCTTTHILNLTMTHSDITSVTACDSYNWPANGITYTTSGMYTFTPPYCDASDNNCNINLISRVQIGSINNQSWCGWLGYHDFTSLSTTVTAGSTYTISVRDIFNNPSGFKVWADWNHNGSFNDPGEYYGLSSGSSMAVPLNAANGNTRMRIRLGTLTGSCGGNPYLGEEVEDYTLVVSGGINICSNTKILNLTINNTTYDTTTISSCASYTWPINGLTYSASGSYSHTVGCLMYTLILTILSTSHDTTVSSCDTYMWSVNGMTYSSSGVYTSTSMNTAGCTHTEILNLSIYPSLNNTTNITACDSYTWPLNGITYTTSGTYTITTSGPTPSYCAVSSNCGSQHIISVGINYIGNYNNGCNSYSNYTSWYTAVTAGNSYQIGVGTEWVDANSPMKVWIDWNHNGQFNESGETYLLNNTPNNNYRFGNIAVPINAFNGDTRMRISTFSNGNQPCGNSNYGEVEDYTLVVSGGFTPCTYTEILNLTINNSSSFVTTTTTINECYSYTWPVNGITYTTSGTYTAYTPLTSTLTYCAAGSNNCVQYIANVQMGSMANVSGCTNYSDYTSMSTAVTAGSTYPISITTGTPYNGDQISVWVDWNQNGMFTDQGETYPMNFGDPITTGNITAPISAYNGNTRMRIRLKSDAGSMDPCGNSPYGNVEDYTLVVSGGFPPCSHTEILNLTIGSSSSNATTIIACDSYTWPVNGLTYSTSGTYIDTSSATITPTYCAAGSNNCVQYIANVQMGSIANVSGCTNYSDYTSLSTAVTAGSTYPISITTGTPYTGDQIRVWVDWNQNGMFTDPGETYPMNFGDPVTTGNIAVPINAGNGNTRMRIRLKSDAGSMDPCGSSPYGNVEDYTLVVSGGVSPFICVHTEVLNLTINPLPVLTSSTAVNPVCSLATTTLTASGANTYSWSGGITNGVPFTANQTTTYTVTGTDANGCSNTLTTSLVVLPLPTVGSTASSTTVCNGSSLTLNGTGATSYSWSGGVNDGIAFIPTTTNTYTVTGTDANGCTNETSISIIVDPCNNVSAFNVKLFLQGYYLGASAMQPALFNQGVSLDNTISDTIQVELRSDTQPYNLVATAHSILNTSGVAAVSIPPIPSGNYYVVIKQRNHVETWSANPVLFTNNSTYDFSTASTQAYGDNQVEIETGIWAIYTGDINQDLAIDALDYILQDPDVVTGASGYLDTDLNGDATVDALDYILLDTNLIYGLGAIIP